MLHRRFISSQWNVVTTCQSPFATSPESRRRVHRPSVCDGTGRRPHCNLVILHQLSVYGKQPELFYLTGCTADTPAHQHVELHLFSLAEPDRRVTSSVRKNVTIGMDAFIHNRKAAARVVSWGFTSMGILNWGLNGVQRYEAAANDSLLLLYKELNKVLFDLFAHKMCFNRKEWTILLTERTSASRKKTGTLQTK